MNRFIQSLETRRLFSGASMGVDQLRVYGTSGDDVISVSATADKVTVVFNGESKDFDRAPIKSIMVVGGVGNDDIQFKGNETGEFKIRFLVIGGEGNDTMVGGPGNDTLMGDAGDDVISGGAGNDNEHGGSGRDKMDGGAGNDRLEGDAQADMLKGGAGSDDLRGGSGNDNLDGGTGRDRCNGGMGNDRLRGGSGNDRLSGGGGSDSFDKRDEKRERVTEIVDHSNDEHKKDETHTEDKKPTETQTIPTSDHHEV